MATKPSNKKAVAKSINKKATQKNNKGGSINKSVIKKNVTVKKVVKPLVKNAAVKKVVKPINKKVAIKKVIKPAVKSAIVKKIAKPAKKATIKPISKSTAKKINTKKPLLKKIAPKTVTSRQKTVKVVAKKNVISKKVDSKKLIKKIIPKKIVSKILVKSAVKKLIPKKVIAEKIVQQKKVIIAKIKSSKKEIAIKPKDNNKASNKNFNHRNLTTSKVIKPIKKADEKLPKAKSTSKYAKVIAPPKPIIKQVFVSSSPELQAAETAKAQVRAKYKKIVLEYPINSARHILFNYLSSSSGLSEWFAEKVDERGDTMVFYWEGSPQQAARLIALKEDHYVRFGWLEQPEALYFEFRIESDEITGDIALIITDFADDDAAALSAKSLWNSQIDKLFDVLGVHS